MTFILQKKKVFFLAVAGTLISIVSVFSVSAQSTEGRINKRPLQDWASKLKTEVQEKKFDLSGAFLVEIKGSLNAEGKFEKGSLTLTRLEGVEALAAAAKDAILAINDSGYFIYLSQLGAKQISILVEQDSSEFSARIISAFDSPNRAKTFASGSKMALELARMKKQAPDATEADRKDLFVLSGLNVKNDGSNILIAFRVTKEEMRDLLMAELSK